MDIWGRQVAFTPDADQVMCGKQPGIQYIGLALGSTGKGWIYDTRSTAESQKDRLVIGGSKWVMVDETNGAKFSVTPP